MQGRAWISTNDGDSFSRIKGLDLARSRTPRLPLFPIKSPPKPLPGRTKGRRVEIIGRRKGKREKKERNKKKLERKKEKKRRKEKKEK